MCVAYPFGWNRTKKSQWQTRMTSFYVFRCVSYLRWVNNEILISRNSVDFLLLTAQCSRLYKIMLLITTDRYTSSLWFRKHWELILVYVYVLIWCLFELRCVRCYTYSVHIHIHMRFIHYYYHKGWAECVRNFAKHTYTHVRASNGCTMFSCHFSLKSNVVYVKPYNAIEFGLTYISISITLWRLLLA